MAEILQQTLDNGLTVLLEPMPHLPSASFELLIPMGSATDPRGLEGSAAVLRDWLFRGAGEHTSRQLSDALDELGVRRGGHASVEHTTFSASLLADLLRPALGLFADALQRPHLLDSEFEPAKALALQELASLDDNPVQRVFVALSEQYFASGHGRSPYGSHQALTAMTAEQVRQDYQQRVSPQGAILAVAGGITWDELLTAVEASLSSWQGPPPAPLEVELRPTRVHHLPAETAQVQIGVAYRGVAPGEPGYYEYALATAVLSSGMSSRLFSEVREKRGLVYAVAAVNRAVRGLGYTLGYAGTTAERADETLQVLLYELRRLSRGVSGEELARARTGILSHLVMQGESSGARASALARDTFLFGQPRTLMELRRLVEQVDLDTINAFLATQADQAFTITTLGPRALSA
ncbi:MAG: insulinase family protein [Truepera sp.]|nr:insulinase family protein [Truepera sp.]